MFEFNETFASFI